MTRPLHARSRLTKVAAGAAAMLLSMAIYAQQRTFDIPAGDLKSALDTYAASTGQQLVYKGDELKGLVSKGAQGAMTPEQALERLLEGTKLKLRRDSSGAVVIFLSEVKDGTSSPETVGTVQQLGSVVVTGISHLSDLNRTGTRTDADPMTLPMSITTVDKELLAQQQVLNLRDAVANVAGVSQLNGDGSFSMRGFSAGIMHNGNLVSSGLNYDAPTVAISRVEVVKGPEAIIAGVTSGYGGVVNVITKTPQAAPVTEVSGTVGSRGYYDVGLDVGRPLTEDKSLLVRFVASKQGAGSTMVGYDGANNEYAAPSLTWRNKGTGTEITGQYEYQKGRTTPGMQVFTNQPGLTDDLKALRYGPASDGKETKSRVTTLSLDQHISDDWSVAVKYSDESRTTVGDTNLTGLGTAFGVLYPEIFTIGAHTDADFRTKIAKLELKGSLETGPVEHKLLLAYDDVRARADQGSQFVAMTSTNLDTGVVTDLAPTLGALFGGLPTQRFGGIFESKENGLLIMDQMLWGNWVALAGWREIRYENTFQGTELGTLKKSLPSLGVLYRVTPTVSLYGSASKGFTPNFGLFGSGDSPVAPEDAQQFELGVKSLLMDKKIATSFSLFSIKQKNVAILDPTLTTQLCNGSLCYTSVPGVKSTGAEVEVSGQVTQGLGIRASYSYTTKKADTNDQIGILYARNQASMWAIYNFGGQAGAGWWMGAGVHARSAAKGQTALDVNNRGQTRFDLSGGYQAKQWSVVGGIKNVTDKRLYTVGSGAQSTGEISQPREFYLSARYNFN